MIKYSFYVFYCKNMVNYASNQICGYSKIELVHVRPEITHLQSQTEKHAIYCKHLFCPVFEPLLQIKEDKVLHEKLQSSLTYGFFKKVMEAFCGSVSPDVPPEQNDKKVNVALVCEATSQLVGIHYHPMTFVLGLGAQYLQEKYSTWINRNMHEGNVSVSMTKHLFMTMISGLITHTNISPLHREKLVTNPKRKSSEQKRRSPHITNLSQGHRHFINLKKFFFFSEPAGI